MSIGLIKWFYKGDSLSQEVMQALLETNTTSMTSKQIYDVVTDKIFKARGYEGSWFEDSKRSAIKSTIKEVFRNGKTFAICKLLGSERKNLLECNNNTNLLCHIEDQLIQKKPDLVKNLTPEEIEYVFLNSSKFIEFLEKAEAGSLSRTAKALMKEIENNTAFKIPQEIKEKYEEYCRQFTDGSTKDEINSEFNALLAKDLRNNFLLRFTELDKESFPKSEKNKCKPSPGHLELQKKVQALARIAEHRIEILSDFSDVDIKFMNKLFGTKMSSNIGKPTDFESIFDKAFMLGE